MLVPFLLALLILMAGLSGYGCASSGNPEIQREDLTSQLKIGESTKEDVRRLFGPPNGTSRYAGTAPHLASLPGVPQSTVFEIWNYTHINTEVDPVTFVPVVGLFAGSATSEVNQLTITFDDKGIVRGVQTGRSKATGGPGASRSQ